MGLASLPQQSQRFAQGSNIGQKSTIGETISSLANSGLENRSNKTGRSVNRRDDAPSVSARARSYAASKAHRSPQTAIFQPSQDVRMVFVSPRIKALRLDG